MPFRIPVVNIFVIVGLEAVDVGIVLTTWTGNLCSSPPVKIKGLSLNKNCQCQYSNCRPSVFKVTALLSMQQPLNSKVGTLVRMVIFMIGFYYFGQITTVRYKLF